jgi:hypothetical protein
MPRVNEKEKTFTILEKNVQIISAVNDPKLSPYLDVFRHYPENVSAQSLGILTGFFKINDFSEESSYVVNFLSSVLKKEYYSNPKRPIENSFDSALRKVNLALSEIAKEGNINWVGKIDGAVCVLEKNNLHFSVSGNAKVLLFRNQFLIEISKDMASEDSEPNPLKTFVNVSSGRLGDGDRMIVCGNDIFEVFSEEEIKKGAIRFPGEKFSQFLRTALANKLGIVGTIVIDIFEKEQKQAVPEKSPEIQNVFSKKIFEDKKTTPKGLDEVLQKEEEAEYTDGKTGHIYIQEKKEEVEKESKLDIFWFMFKEKSSDIFYWIKSRGRKRLLFLGRSIANAKNNISANIKLRLEERRKLRAEKEARIKQEKAEADANVAKEEIYRAEEAEKTMIGIKTPSNQNWPVYNEPFLARLARRKEELEKQENEKNQLKSIEISQEEKSSFFKKIIPDFGKIKNIFVSFGRKQKIYAIIIILLIFIVPFAFLKVRSLTKKTAAPPQAEIKTPSTKEIFSQEKNIVFLDNLDSVFDIQGLKNVSILNGKIIAAGASQITTRDADGNIKEIPWTEGQGQIQEASPMKDLNLELIYTDQNKVVSFLSATSQFGDNAISIPDGSKITGIGTYLTYLYMLDSQKSQIYRYPRATGGFGNKTDWLKDSLDLSDSCCMAIDENVYLISSGSVIKLFKGQKQEFSLEPTINSYIPGGIFTDGDTQNLYILDKGNGRIIKYGKDGTLIGQYFSEAIKNTVDFTVDEKNNKVYLANPQGLSSFNLQ